MATSINITILGWDKYNPRKDVAAPSWFRMQHNLFSHWQFYDFTHVEMCAWIYFLCEASHRNEGGKLTVNYEHAHRVARIDSTAINSAIKKLKQNQVIEVRTLRGRYADVSNPCTTRRTEQDETERTNVTNETYAPAIVADVSTPKQSLNPEGPSAGALAWRAYKAAYQAKYGEAPPWNAKIAGQLKSFISRIPSTEAPDIATFYLTHTDRFYVQSMHPVGLMLRDAEKLRTEWLTGRRMTSAHAKNSESADYANDQLRRIKEGTL